MRFRYLKDRLFLFCLVTYFVNRWFIKPHVHGGFFHTSFNDCICIPFWVPIMLSAMRRLRLRTHDQPPTFAEIGIPVAMWSYVFKVWLPYAHWLSRRPAADPTDILCFAAGGLFAILFWDRWYGSASGRTMAQADSQ